MRFPETVTRRNLPHWYMPGAAHFVTCRLHGSLPQPVLNELHNQKEALLKRKPPPGLSTFKYRERVHKQLFGLYDQWLDRQKDDLLRDPRIAALIRSNLYYHNGSKYHLMAHCVMPNHVHFLLQPPVTTAVGELCDQHSPLARIMHSLKSYTAHKANKFLKRTGAFWQAESYDHWVRDEDELERIVDYIRSNPVKAGLKERPEVWFWCSCHDRFLQDGDASGWLVATGGPPMV
jgi:putative transposase